MENMGSNNDLFVFGYSSKIFRDDEKAEYIDKGKHLIPWMGEKSIMIDRYDVRGLLHDLKQYEPTPGAQFEEQDSEEEKLCNEERYRSLRAEVLEEQLYQEEELKRFRDAVASDGAYHEIGFSYDNEVEEVEVFCPKVEEPEDEPYQQPSGIKIPNGMEVPSNMRIHAIIERTALFVSEQGGQMEVIIKLKQDRNPQFAFMHLDNPLYPYYQHLVMEIKSGSYKPIQTKKASESEDEDGHYLHPSLLCGKKENVPKFTVPSINFQRSPDDSYSVLVKNLQQQFAEEQLARDKEDQLLVNNSLEGSLGNESMTNSHTSIAVPPPEIQPIIQKTAEYAARIGVDFEYAVKSKNDKRLEFLNESSIYYEYYIQLRNEVKASLHSFSSTTKDTTVKTNEDSSSVCQKSKMSTEGHAMQIGYSGEVGIPNGSKTKASEVLKGPIYFSLKAKNIDSVLIEKPKVYHLFDNLDEDSTEIDNKENSEVKKMRKSIDDSRPAPDFRHNSAKRKEKAKLICETEAKLNEEQMKYELLGAIRDKFVRRKKEKQLDIEKQKRKEEQEKDKQLKIEQQSKLKQLQLERKRKAVLFLKMLEKKNSELDTCADRVGTGKKTRKQSAENEIKVPVTKLCHITTSCDIPPTMSGIKRKQSDGSESEKSGDNIMITEFCSNLDIISQTTEVVAPDLEKLSEKCEHKKKKKLSCSRNRKHHSKSYHSRDQHRSSSPESSKHKKSKQEKEYPATFALAWSRC